MSAGLNIAALARRTGVAPDTLRKWEQRYRILQPTRTSGGQRRYSERDVDRVQWLQARLQEGYRIGEAAALLGGVETGGARTPREHLDGLLAALGQGDPAEIGLRLDQAFALNALEDVLDEILRPLLETVGSRWESGELSVAEEHLVSEAVRSRLGHLLADSGGGIRGVAVLACAPNEQHELGLMMAAIALRRDGWKVVYLGADTPLEDAVELAGRLSARILGVSVGTGARRDELRAAGELPLPDGVELVVGGRVADEALARDLGGRYAGSALESMLPALRAL